MQVCVDMCMYMCACMYTLSISVILCDLYAALFMIMVWLLEPSGWRAILVTSIRSLSSPGLLLLPPS